MKDVEVVALSGGVGGAKLALGLSLIVPDERLACIVNGGDDFDHLGLRICPDLDTLLYTLAGCANPDTGWGRRDETWTFMRVLGQLGGPTWFSLGDGDLAMHVERTRRLAAGETLVEITADMARRLGARARLLPMSEQPVRTRLETDAGMLEFQQYFVARQASPVVRGIAYHGAQDAVIPAAVAAAFSSPALRAVVICPSNPYLSIAPMLAVPGLRAALQAASAPVVAVSPIIGGRSVKGPTGKIMRELGLEPAPQAVAECYRGLIDGLVIDEVDRAVADSCGIRVHVTHTLMQSLTDRRRLAAEVLEFAGTLQRP